MPNQEIIDNIRQENHPLLIYQAFNDNAAVVPIATRLISFISNIYRSLEPEHFEGQIVIFSTLGDQEVLPFDDGTNLYDRTILTNNTSEFLVLQVFEDGARLPLMWDADPADLFDNDQVLAYSYQNRSECFYANTQQIAINNPYNCASIYALHYQSLIDSLQSFREEIRRSSCTIFRECWGDDENCIFFVNAPESKMQESLEQHIRKSVRGVNVVREYNIGGSKPVDVRVDWREANRQALIELKWLGKARKPDGNLTSQYSDRRANDGALQLKEYLDIAERDTPTLISKGYLVVIDGRRYWTNKNTTTITRAKGLHFSGTEITFEANRKYHLTMKNYERPIRIFTEPLCVD